MPAASVVVTIPHCSTKIPSSCRSDIAVPQSQVVRHTDLATDRIFSLPCAGHTIKAEASRYVVDLNRARGDFSDLGVIIGVDWDNMRVPSHELSAADIEARLKRYYDSFHAQVEKALASCNGRVLLVDGHSMNSLAPRNAADAGKERPQITLGTRNFSTASREVAERLCELMGQLGYETKHDTPFAGGHIVQCFGKPPAVEAIQFEANKKLYLDEQTLKVDDGAIETLQKDISGALCRLAEELG